jgi:hypothetical protein
VENLTVPSEEHGSAGKAAEEVEKHTRRKKGKGWDAVAPQPVSQILYLEGSGSGS